MWVSLSLFKRLRVPSGSGEANQLPISNLYSNKGVYHQAWFIFVEGFTFVTTLMFLAIC